MWTRPLGADTFDILRAPLVPTGATGSMKRDWSAATSTTVVAANVQPFPLAEKLNFEDNKSREFARSAIRIFAPPGTDIQSTDRILFMGKEYDVFGHAGPWRDFNGNAMHVEVVARLREG